MITYSALPLVCECLNIVYEVARRVICFCVLAVLCPRWAFTSHIVHTPHISAMFPTSPPSSSSPQHHLPEELFVYQNNGKLFYKHQQEDQMVVGSVLQGF